MDLPELLEKGRDTHLRGVVVVSGGFRNDFAELALLAVSALDASSDWEQLEPVVKTISAALRRACGFASTENK